MAKPQRGGSDAASFFDLEGERMSSNPASRNAKSHTRSASASAKSQLFIDGIFGGHRAVLYNPKKKARESERSVQLRVITALAARGVLVLTHTVEACYRCRAKPTKKVGLGRGTIDLICIVPPYGRFLGIEMKKPKYSPSDVDPDQRKWLAVLRRYGAITGIASSEEEALALLKEAQS